MSSKKGNLRISGKVISAILCMKPGSEMTQIKMQKQIGVSTGGTSPIFNKAVRRGYLTCVGTKGKEKCYIRTEKNPRIFKNGKHPKKRTVSEQQLPLPLSLKSESTSIRDLTIDLLVCQYKERLKSMHDNSLVELLKKQFAHVLV